MKKLFSEKTSMQFIGIDQTGAWNAAIRKPRPLAMAIIRPELGRWKFECLPLAQFTPQGFAEANVKFESTSTLIATDCVFWSHSSQTFKNLKTDFKNAHQWRLIHQRVSREIAQAFFRTHGRPAGTKRPVDQKMKAQSLYSPTPFQRNIQTGTFRIWSELGENPLNWIGIYPWSPIDSDVNTWAVEAYPSYAWNSIFNSKIRNPKKLPHWIQKRFSKQLIVTASAKALISKDGNYADAAVLALQAFLGASQLQRLNRREQIEQLRFGYIFGDLK